MNTIPFETKVYESIHEISPEEWNSINKTEDVFHSHLFLSNLEDAKVENSENHYLMLYADGDLVATAVISSFIVNLDIFIQANRLVKTIRKVWPGWLKIKMLICGIPASLGQKNIVIKDNRFSSDVIKKISVWMDDEAKKKKIKYLAFKEFREKEIPSYDVLQSNGYFRAFSLPYAYLDINWKDFDGYLKDVRHGYKRQIVSSLKKIGLKSNFSPLEKSGEIEFPVLMMADSSVCTPEMFYPSYMEVMKRTASKLETFNEEFFRLFFNSQNENLIFLVLKDEHKVYGSAVLAPHGNELTFALVGKHPEKDEFDTYFNLITFIVKYGIENGFEKINMGQTSYYPKMKMGAITENEYIYFKSRKRILHGLLKSFRKIIFPETKVQTMNVFKTHP